MRMGMRPDSIAAGIRRSEAQHLEGLAELSFVGLKPLTSFRDEVPRRGFFASVAKMRASSAAQRSEPGVASYKNPLCAAFFRFATCLS